MMQNYALPWETRYGVSLQERSLENLELYIYIYIYIILS